MYVTRQLYFPDTAILITRFMTPDGVGEVIDFMPVQDPQRATDRHRLVRVVRVRPRRRCGSSWSARPGSTTAASPTSWSVDRARRGVPHPGRCS